MDVMWQTRLVCEALEQRCTDEIGVSDSVGVGSADSRIELLRHVLRFNLSKIIEQCL